jgi:hypothetical protein
MTRKLFSLFSGLLLLVGAVPSWGALVDVGPSIDPHGYPAWYQDASQLKVELCAPAPAGHATRPDLCIGDPLELDANGNPINPIVLTGESFYWMASAAIPLGAGEATIEFALEATFGGAEAPIDGQQITFGRTRIRIDTPTAGTYTITHPYGTQVFEVPVAEDGINYTADIGSANFLSPAIGFRGTLAAFGPTPASLLTWPNYATNPDLQVRGPADPITGEPGPLLEQYVGNPNVASTVVGGTNGNIFRVQGPGVDVQTDQFFIMGKVYDPTKPLTAHVFPGVPEQKLFAVGPVNRETPFAPTSPPGLITGQLFTYAYGYPLWYQEKLPVLTETGEQATDPVTGLPQF